MDTTELNALIIQYHNIGKTIRELEDKANEARASIVKEMVESKLVKYETGNLQALMSRFARKSINVKEAEVLLDKDTFDKLAKETIVTQFRVIDMSKENVK